MRIIFKRRLFPVLKPQLPSVLPDQVCQNLSLTLLHFRTNFVEIHFQTTTNMGNFDGLCTHGLPTNIHQRRIDSKGVGKVRVNPNSHESSFWNMSFSQTLGGFGLWIPLLGWEAITSGTEYGVGWKYTGLKLRWEGTGWGKGLWGG